MREYIFFMHTDALSEELSSDWVAYLEKLKATGLFRGGSAIGAGQSIRKEAVAGLPTSHISGYIRVEASDLSAAMALLNGNPTYEAGGAVEIRELILDT